MIEYRPQTPDEWRAVSAMTARSLLQGPPDDDAWERGQRAYAESDSVAAWDDVRCVGSARAFRFDTVVPGGATLPTAGVTGVAVATTHRRRGIVRELLTLLLREARHRGQALASLRASEATIYGRFGFAVAGEFDYLVVDAATARPIAGEAVGTMRLLDRDEIYDTIDELYRRVALTRPGVVTRPRFLTERYLRDAVEGTKPHHVAVHTGPDGNDDGFVHYSVAWSDAPALMLEIGEGKVYDLYGATPTVERELWRHLCSVDLIEQWHATERPPDDVIRAVAANRRAVSTRMHIDEQWLRLLDVDAALAARSFPVLETPLTIEVRDPLFADNCGRWTIAGGAAVRDDGAGAAKPVDLAVDIGTLSAAYLGGRGWWELAVAAEATTAGGGVPDADVLTRADALFNVRPLPYCGSFF